MFQTDGLVKDTILVGMERRRLRRWSTVQCPVDALSKVKVGEPAGPPPNHTMPCFTIQYIPHQTYHTISWDYVCPERPTTKPYHAILYHTTSIIPSISYHAYHTTILSVSQPAHHQTISWHNLLYHTLPTILKDSYLTIPLNLSCQS